MEAEIDSLLKKLLAVNDAMSRITSEGATTTSVTQKLARHRDILHEFNQVITFGRLELSFYMIYDICSASRMINQRSFFICVLHQAIS